MSSKKVCKTCGAVLKHPKRHKQWHKWNRPIPGPPGPVGPMGMSEPHTRWEDVKAEREGPTVTETPTFPMDLIWETLRAGIKTTPRTDSHMNALDAIVILALDSVPCHRSESLPELCGEHGSLMRDTATECDMIAARRREMTSALVQLQPVLIDWLAGMIEGVGEDMAGEVGLDVRAGYRGAAHLLRRWDPWIEFEDDA